MRENRPIVDGNDRLLPDIRVMAEVGRWPRMNSTTERERLTPWLTVNAAARLRHSG
jgi:hypothetical protein